MEKIFSIAMCDLYASLAGSDVQKLFTMMYVSEHRMPDVIVNKDRILLVAIFIFIVVNLHHTRFLTRQSEFNNLYHYNTILI
mgnify:CR=1 FL=1